tara:strand:- start:13 stop:249 length:237 start_codon:yes stop_codon:yes gene_type:complete
MDFNITVKVDPFVTIRKCKLPFCDNVPQGRRTTCSAKCRVKMNRWKRERLPWTPSPEEIKILKEWKEKHKSHLKLTAR